jgi:hypothetical protein
MVLELAAHTWYSKRTLPEAATSTNSTAQTTLDQNVEENRELTLENWGTEVTTTAYSATVELMLLQHEEQRVDKPVALNCDQLPLSC